MRVTSAVLLSLSLAACGPAIRNDMPEAQARAAIVGFLANKANGCTDAAFLDLRNALASYAVHMDAAERTWPHPFSYRLAPAIEGKEIKLRALDETDMLALLAVRDGLAKTSDFAPLSRAMINTTWAYHTPKIDRKPFGAYSENVRVATCDAFVAMARSRFEFERVMMQRTLTRRAQTSTIDSRARNMVAAECALTNAITAAGGDAGPCRDR